MQPRGVGTKFATCVFFGPWDMCLEAPISHSLYEIRCFVFRSFTHSPRRRPLAACPAWPRLGFPTRAAGSWQPRARPVRRRGPCVVLLGELSFSGLSLLCRGRAKAGVCVCVRARVCVCVCGEIFPSTSCFGFMLAMWPAMLCVRVAMATQKNRLFD